MGILSDRDIMESLMTGYIGISDFSERGLTPNGYDLRIAEISVRGDPEIKREGVVTIRGASSSRSDTSSSTLCCAGADLPVSSAV